MLGDRDRGWFGRSIRIAAASPIPIGDNDVFDAAVRWDGHGFQCLAAGRVAACITAGNVRYITDAFGVGSNVVIAWRNRHTVIGMGECGMNPPPSAVIQVEEHDHDG
jgi:hypothetical protein